MKNIKSIENKISNLKETLNEKYHVEEIGIFGSYVNNSQNKESDLDILIGFSKSISLLKFVELENFLSNSIGIKVDLVMKSSLKPRIGKHILNSVKYL